jgi:hypothetical protein
MSQIGHERRFGSVSVISGLPQEADAKPVFQFEAQTRTPDALNCAEYRDCLSRIAVA